MKKTIISILLCISMIFSTPLSLAAMGGSQENTISELPLVIVRGMDFTGLYVDKGTENERPAIDDISFLKVFKALFSAGLKYGFGKNEEAAVDEIGEFVADIFKHIACDNLGNSVFDVGPYTYPGAIGNHLEYEHGNVNEWGILKTAAEIYGGENVYYFVYDWRLNPLDIADGINETVNLALMESGKDKVNLINASLGGIMATAYLTKYGHEKLNKCIFLSSTAGGSNMITDLFKGDAHIDSEALYNTLNFHSSNALLKFIVNLLYKTGFIDSISKFANNFIETYKIKAYDEVIRDSFGHTLSLWALIQPENYEECKDFMFSGKEGEYTDFIAKTDALHEMMKNRDSMLLAAAEEGLEIAIVCAYDTPAYPLTKTAYNAHTDGMLETYNMSLGATVANYNETLNESILNSGSAYISPDGVIDASTALFPEHTWFIKSSVHVGCDYGTEQSDFLFWLVNYESSANIRSNEKYPQFMLSSDTQILSPLNN